MLITGKQLLLFSKVLSKVKGILSDSNNIFLWYESEDFKQKKLVSKISVDSNFTFSSYARLCVFHCSHIDYCVVRDFSVKIDPFSIRCERPARERHKICIASQENFDNQAPRNTNFTH